jgi:hypothetical protein
VGDRQVNIIKPSWVGRLSLFQMIIPTYVFYAFFGGPTMEEHNGLALKGGQRGLRFTPSLRSPLDRCSICDSLECLGCLGPLIRSLLSSHKPTTLQ